MRARSAGFSWRLTVWALIACALAWVMVAEASAGTRGGTHALYVSPSGSNSHTCTRREPCRTIGHAVSLARAGDVIYVAPGRYREEVTLSKRLTLVGQHSPVIQAQGFGRGILIRGSRARGAAVRGFDVKGATYEGILALRTRDVTIADNVVSGNDRGYFEKHFTGECSYNGQPPGATIDDLRAGGCGEAIHLASTSHSRVTGNLVTDNTGGIYLTDESGPAAHNLIAHNVVISNLYDCGITLASHSTRAVSAHREIRQRAGGVYDNTIIHNIADFNGTREAGAGILVAAAFQGSAAYGNRIVDNTATGNGLPGVALHSHFPLQDLNSNVIEGNTIGRNAIGGSSGGPGDGDGGIHHTAGILVWSAVTNIRHVRVFDNVLSDDYFGVWTDHVPRLRRSANSYRRVQVPLRQRNLAG